MCRTHMRKEVQKKNSKNRQCQFREKDDQKWTVSNLDTLQVSPIRKVFGMAVKLYLLKHEKYAEFDKYFRSEWID